MKIVVLDGHALNPGDLDWGPFADLGQLTVHPRTPPEQLLPRAAGAAVLLTNKTRLDAATLASLTQLRYVGVLATGYDVVDVRGAAEGGVCVTNVPDYGTASVAQLTFALMLELARRVGDHHRAVQSGAWNRSPDYCFWLTPQLELSGRTLGIVGLGRIGRAVARIGAACGMRVVAAQHGADPAAPELPRVALDRLLEESDVVSLHCPLTPATRGLINAARLARMRPGAFLINTARGGLVDEAALAEALGAGTLAGAAVDVLSSEPPAPDHPLLKAPRCIITPHLAWATLEARGRLLATAADNLRQFLAGTPCNVVC